MSEVILNTRRDFQPLLLAIEHFVPQNNLRIRETNKSFEKLGHFYRVTVAAKKLFQR